MKKELKKSGTAALLGAKPVTSPALTLASLVGRAKAMVSATKAEAAPTAAKRLQARVASPQTTTSVGSIRRLPARTGSK